MMCGTPSGTLAIAYRLDICFSLAMLVMRAVAFVAPLVVVLAGCATRTPSDDSSAEWLVDERAAEDDWFCEPAEDGGWDCVQDPERVANPRPVRLPKPLFAEPRAVAPELRQTFGAEPGARSDRPAAAPFRPPPEDPELPLYQQLSFQPDRSTALTDLPGSYYAIQLIALSSLEDLEQFIADNDLPVMSGTVVEKDGERFYALLAGIYTDRETAERAARSLPEKLSAHQPWIRSMESLQSAMARAKQLAEET